MPDVTLGGRVGWRSGLVALLLVPGLGACSGLVAGPGAPPASSTATPYDPSAAPVTALQQRLDGLAAQITGGRDEADVPGCGGLSVDPQHASLDLWWVGEPPDRVRRLVAHPTDGLTVVVHPAHHDVAAMVHAVVALTRRYPVLHTAGPEHDGSGIEVETTATGLHTLPSARRLAAEVGMPVRVVVSAPPTAA